MSGTKQGGKRAYNTTLNRKGIEFYQEIGKLGGMKGTGHAFAHGKLDAADAGRMGGRKKGYQATPAQKLKLQIGITHYLLRTGKISEQEGNKRLLRFETALERIQLDRLLHPSNSA